MPSRPVDRLTAANLEVGLRLQRLETYLRQATAHQTGAQPMAPDEIQAWRSAIEAALFAAEEAAEELLWALRHYRLAEASGEQPPAPPGSPVVSPVPSKSRR